MKRALVVCSTKPRGGSFPLKPGFLAFEGEVGAALGMTFDVRLDVPPGEFGKVVAEAGGQAGGVDVVMLAIDWQHGEAEVLGAVEGVRAVWGGPVVLLDGSDQTASPFLGALPYVDLMVKSQVLRDRSAYTRGGGSGYVFADFLAEKMGYDLGGWRFGSVAAAEQVGKIEAGWTLGVAPRIRKMLSLPRVPWALRPFDFHCRVMPAGAAARDWYERSRKESAEALQRATRGMRVTGWERVKRSRYLMEMAGSRVVFSPFGWGEVCHRDYEAVALGCLLLKPSMEHLEGRPDIYRANETYVPVKWDLSDLEEKCRWCVENSGEAKRIARNARGVLKAYYDGGGLAGDLGRVLRRVLKEPVGVG